MENRTFYNEILTDHNLHPLHKEKLPDANLVLEGVNPSCGDDIILQLKVEDGQVVDGAFEGSGCRFTLSLEHSPDFFSIPSQRFI